MARGVLACPPVRVAGPPVGAPVLLNVDGKDCPYPVPTFHSGRTRELEASRRHGPEARVLAIRDDHEAGSAGQRAGAVRHGAAGDAQTRADLRHRSGGADVLGRRRPNAVGTCTSPTAGTEPRSGSGAAHPGSGRARVAEIRSAARSCRWTSSRTPRAATQVPTGLVVRGGARCAPAHVLHIRDGAARAQPRTPAPLQREQPRPGAQPQEEEEDPELQAALAASREQQDLDELAKWPHLAETLRTSALEEAAGRPRRTPRRRRGPSSSWRAVGGGNASAALGGGAPGRALAEEERWHGPHGGPAAAEEQLGGESARRSTAARAPASPPNLHSLRKGRSGSPAGVPGALRRLSRNSASPPGASSSSTPTTTVLWG
ncbi:hypothetical protein QYE76_044276 [Lolium multiflorum]|uniref:Uncharacterized protein n=1 Tax=Lolium multiflorum TaxID=4521 RepID=A0AAD8TKC4_LOLMU|nr:hypothetical protein QYE76_044276 [Lolium multiflorum]